MEPAMEEGKEDSGMGAHRQRSERSREGDVIVYPKLVTWIVPVSHA